MIEDDGTWYENFRTDALKDPEILVEYEAYKLSLEIVEKLKQVRKKAHVTQEKVAKEMLTSKSAVARLEAGGGNNKHSPSLNTLVRYAKTLGYHLEIRLIPDHVA